VNFAGHISGREKLHVLRRYPLLKKLPTFNKDLAVFSLETVRLFKSDAEAAGYTL